VLVTIWRNGPLTLKQIAELTGNAPPAASRIVDRMIAGGLLIRQTDKEDRRAILVDVSEKGESLRELQKIYKDVNEVLLDDLSDREVQQLFDLLDRVQTTGRAWLAKNNE